MGDMGDLFRDLKAHNMRRAAKNLASADPAGWVKHTPWHWSREFNGKRPDYWPSRNRFQYEGKVMTGDVGAWMRKRSPTVAEK